MAKVSRLGVMNLRLCLNEADWLSKLAHLMRFHYYGSRIIFQTCLLDEAGDPITEVSLVSGVISVREIKALPYKHIYPIL